MSKLDFAFWDVVMAPPQDSGAATTAFDDHLALGSRLERLGWHSYFTIEHQSNPGNLTSAPSVYLAALARETSKMRLGAMMWQLPFYQPLRLASEIATLDQISHGRVEFGTGIGVHEHEFIRWGMNYYERAAISEEVLQIVKMAWTQNEVTFHGKYFDYEEALPEPRPYQQPYPPIWAAVHSDAAVEFAARNNYHVAQNLDTDEVVAQKFDLYRKVWKESKHEGPMPRVFLQRAIFVAETDEKAHEEASKYIGHSGGGRVGSGPIAETRVGWGSNKRGMGTDSERPDDARRGQTMTLAGTDYQYNIDNGLAIVGSPDTVIKKLQAQQELVGYDIFCTSCSIGRMPRALVNNSIELIGKEVIPAFK